MVSSKNIDEQLSRIHFKRSWNRSETDELATILLPDEEIFECVNGWYEGGFALLCATNVRVLLIDKKPFKFLTVEDVRFDTISQIDYSHRLFDAGISISTGIKNLHFRSTNQPRLRKLITHVQHRMAELKRMEHEFSRVQEPALDELDQQLKAFMMSQYKQHLDQDQQHVASSITLDKTAVDINQEIIPTPLEITNNTDLGRITTGVSSSDLYEEGVKEIYGKYLPEVETIPDTTQGLSPAQLTVAQEDNRDIGALSIAYSKLPMILKSRKAGLAVATN